MLTKDLVRYKVTKNQIIPQFIDPDKADEQQIAQQLIDFFQSSQGDTRDNLHQGSKDIIEESPCDQIVSRGLEKLLLDRTEFDTSIDEPLTAYRQKIFLYTSQQLSSGSIETLTDYYEKIQQHFNQPVAQMSEQLYGDLPSFQKVLNFKSMSVQGLLNRYNCGQIQALLLHCEQLKLTFNNPEPALLRQLFKYLRFYQLLAQVETQQKCYTLIIDGPLSLFSKTKKYGLNLANFFPAVLHQTNWILSADIHIQKRKSSHLEVNETCGIKSHYRQFHAYVPEEIQWFQSIFEKEVTDWKIYPAHDFLALTGEQYCFPDYTLQHQSGKKIYLELFHMWHETHLIARLNQIKSLKEPILIIGVSKHLSKNKQLLPLIEESEYFKQYGFHFREMPTVDKIRPVLAQIFHVDC